MKISRTSLPVLFACAIVLIFPRSSTTAAESALWKAGTATVDITPTQPQWMSGYGGRTKPAEGTLHKLYVRVLALEDAGGHRAVVMATDLLGIPQSIYDNISARLQRAFGLKRDQIMIHASHSHCTPVLRNHLYDAYPLPDSQRPVIEKFSSELEAKIEQTVGEAFGRLAPATLSAGQGVTRFAVNRRNNPEASVPNLIQAGALKGPVDHDVPVLSVTGTDGKLKAVVFGYACHNTVLSFYQWAGDYAGFAQNALERSHPGAVALFFMGCGADQNPLPRREVYQAERYGHMLAAAVEEVLLQKPAPLAPQLRTAHEFATLKMGDAPTREELEQGAKEKPSTLQRWSARLLGELQAGKTLARSYPYPVQVWQLGGSQLWIALGGEVVVDYALRFKGEFGRGTWVAGYANDVMAYIPSKRVLDEDKPPRAPGRSGYEGNTSMYVYGQPAHRWADDVEFTIATSVQKLVGQVRAPAAK
jgi:hypothetical protein